MKLLDSAPDYAHGYLRVPLAIWAALYCQAPVTRRQLQLVSVILRESWGWQTKDGQVYRWTRSLTSRQLSAATGLATDHLTQDLQRLVDGGLLRQQGQCYQLVADPTLWKTRLSPPSKPRREGVISAAATAKAALSPPHVKKAKKLQRNVPRSRESEFSPPGDNSTAQQASMGMRPTLSWATTDTLAEPGVAERLVLLIEAFVGPLPAAEVQTLREWTQEAGVVPIWDALEPFFRQGAPATRCQLQTLLRERVGWKQARLSSDRRKEADAG
jgi:hypothetical protein